MGSPSLDITDVLKALKSKISDNLSAGESVEIAPALIPKQYTDIKYTVSPVDVDEEYTNATDGSDTIVIPRCTARIWASIGLIGGIDGSFEYAVIGIDADNKKGVCSALRWVKGIIRDYFMADEDVRSFKFISDKPTFVVVEDANNQAALAGSFRVEVTGSMTAAVETPLVYGTRTMAAKVPFVQNVQVTDVDYESATIIWTTNFPSTSFVQYSAGSGNPLSNQTTEDETLTTSHEVTITGLTAEQYYEFRPCSRDPNSTRVGKSHDRYNFTTEAEGGDIIFSDYELSKNPIPNTVNVHWSTTPDTKGKIRWRPRGSSGNWTETTLEVSFRSTHTAFSGMKCTPGAAYEMNAYGITEGGIEEWNYLKYIKISEAGKPEFEY